MTEAQKDEYLKALWSIIMNFVELGFGVHPLQEVCGQDQQIDSHSAKTTFNRIGLQEFSETTLTLKHDLTISVEAE